LAAAADGPPSDDAPAMAAEATRMPKPRVSSRVLLGAGGELVIDHEGREYRLRITQNGKLILTA
jgi:hemin uptake protein HemP